MLSLGQHGPAHARILRGDGYDGSPITASLGQSSGPAAYGIGLAFGSHQKRSGPQDQQHSQVVVASFSDVSQPLFAARTVLTGDQTKPGAELAATAEIVTIADGSYERGCGGRPDAWQTHQLLGRHVARCLLLDVPVVLRDSLVQTADLAKQVAHDGIGPTRQVFQAQQRLAPHSSSLERQHNTELAEQASDAI